MRYKRLFLENAYVFLTVVTSKRRPILIDNIALLKESHIFLLPSIKAADGNEEGIPNALKEAMAMGLPVIATFHAGNTELIEDGISGYLVLQKDVAALTQKMMYLIEHPEEWKSLSVNARKTVEERFEINKNIEKLEALFYQLLETS